MNFLVFVVITTILCSMNSLVAMEQSPLRQSPEQFDTLYQLSKKIVAQPTKEKYFAHFVALIDKHSFSQRACDFLIAKEEELRPTPCSSLSGDEVYATPDGKEEYHKSLQYQRVVSMLAAVRGNTIN